VLIRLEDKFRKASDLHRKGLLESARLVCEEILSDQAIHFDALNLLGLIAAQTRNPTLAVTLLAQAITVNPANAFTHCNLGRAQQELEQWDASLASYDRAVALKPDYAAAYSNRGNVLRRLGRLHEALASFDQAIELQPNFVEAHVNRGNVLGELHRWPLALASHDTALSLRPDFAEAHCNRGLALKALLRPGEALASFDKAIALWPGHAEAHVNRGNVLGELQEFEAAIAAYNRAIAIQKDYAPAHVNRGLVSLLNGNFERGWADYEWRWRDTTRAQAREARRFSKPLWLGKENLAGETILLHHEQGLGATLQFCRYAERVADQGATVILGVQKPLLALLDGLAGVTQLVSEGTAIPDFDYHCPLMSLPLAFNTRLHTIPAQPGYLRADAVKVAHWRARLASVTGPRIGLVWSGNAVHSNDHHRSIPLAELLRFLPDDCHYVSLQKDLRATDQPLLRSHPRIIDAADELHDFSDSAALCQCLDLVITVDTSVAHLNGALGNKTWLLLPFNPDWRWLLQREDSPWYPTLKLYRQPRLGDWQGVLSRVGADLIRTFDG
jgi:tetratricopeptide (TPR) repeat protein